MDWLVALPVALVLAAQLAGWMALRNLFLWKPAAAVLAGSDYDESERNFDRVAQRFGRHSLADGTTIDGTRLTDGWFRFEDEAGERHEITVTRWLTRGEGPEAAIMVWYDPKNPRRWTTTGPFAWFALSAGLAAATVWLFLDRGETLARLIAQ